jgi:hypothetical protein
MPLINFTNLDFDQVKSSLKDFLRSNSNFTDYDFEGSNLSVIIDLLAYNTYITSYNANMISNEIFIDSATLRENVVSLARNIGYVPRSRTAARASINFFVDTTELSTNPVTLTLKKGIVCSSSINFGGENYTFAIPNDITVPVINGIAFFENIEVFEGFFTVQNFTVNSNNPNQRFILTNPNIDTSTINVSVKNTETSSVTRKFILSDNIINVNPHSKVFFIQEIEDQRYEIIFGDGVFGEKLDNLNYIDVSYIITSGESGNGISNFTYSGRLIDDQNRVVNNGVSLITTGIISRSGKEIESVLSIKNYAPRIYASQNRAVTAGDFEALIPRIYPEAESVSVFGGEDLNPPKFGKVFISVKPFDGPFIPNSVKDNLRDIIRKYSTVGTVPEFIDLKFLYVEFDSSVYYNSNLVVNSNQLLTKVTENLTKFSKESEINRFGARFKYSKFLKIIDDSDNSITSNITKIRLRRDLKVRSNVFTNYEICYGNEFYISSLSGFNIKSSSFRVNGIQKKLYLTDIPISDKEGDIVFFEVTSNGANIVNRNAGSINYKKGEIILNTVNISSTSIILNGNNFIEISTTPRSNDVIGLQDLYLQIDISKSKISVIPDKISSGTDISGTNYIFTSSYLNGDAVRN